MNEMWLAIFTGFRRHQKHDSSLEIILAEPVMWQCEINDVAPLYACRVRVFSGKESFGINGVGPNPQLSAQITLDITQDRFEDRGWTIFDPSHREVTMYNATFTFVS
jgi:hypothetical protein